MEIEYRKLGEKELDVFIEMRINQLREEGAKEDIDLKPALLDYYIRHMDLFITVISCNTDFDINRNFTIFELNTNCCQCCSVARSLLVE